MRVHILAKALNVTSKAILLKCAAEGLPVKNHMTALGPGLEATIREWFTEGQHATAVETADRVDLEKARIRRRKKKAEAKPEVAAAEAPAAAPPELSTAVAEAPAAAVGEVGAPVAEPPDEAPPQVPEATPPAPGEPAVAAPPEKVAPITPGEEEQPPPSAAPPALEPEAAGRMVAEAAPPAEKVEAAPSGPTVIVEPPKPPEPVRPAGPQNVPAPAKLKGPRVVRYEEPDRGFTVRARPGRRRPPPGPETGGQPPVIPPTPERGFEQRRRPGEARKGVRSSASPRRQSRRGSEVGVAEKLREWRDQDLIERRERLAGATGRKIHRHRAVESAGGAVRAAPAERKTKAQVHEPVLVKEFCAQVGVPFVKVLQTLQRQHGMMASINTTLPNDLAELLALEEGVELEVIKAKSQLDALHEEFEVQEPKKPGPRPPVVTFLGHVDHGKTSLLDAIRATRVALAEDGGITQHIGAYHLKRDGVAVTFLDTPGHQAFTAMRARGAQLTDVVVLVVAADDGVMPQTIEAINHAKAAEVPIVVAVTKIDLGIFNEAKVYGQLAEQGLTPSGEWGGHTDVIKTSAVTGEGIDELLEHLSALAELMDLEADHAGDPAGAVIEAETREGVGAAVRVLVQRGKLRPGTVLACGNAFGKVRAILDDQGRRLKEAGPSVPCEVWGLDEVPSAGDRFYGIKSMQQAKALAEEIRQARVQQARAGLQKARSLEDVFKQRDAEGTPQLNVIIRADVDGSVDALSHVLEQLPTDQVNLVIRHAGVGAVTDSDVHLADASDAIIIAFRVAPGVSPRKLAEEAGVDIREYQVIYDVIDDITKALEGLLEPEEKIELRATMEVRDVFKITKVGTVAGCYITDGVVARHHRARLLREGAVIREDCRIESLRRFKDDAKEVRAGMECGIRLEAFNDIKRGDVIEAYEVVQVARTLQRA